MKILLNILFVSFFFHCYCQTVKRNINPFKGNFDNIATLPITRYFFNYTVSGTDSMMSSGGIFMKSGSDTILIRTLWATDKKAPGTYTAYWDGTNDTGVVVPVNPLTCIPIVTTNEITYTWEGGIGNTSKDLTGDSIHKGLYYNTAMCFSGKYVYAGQSYNEGTTRTYKFDSSSIQVRKLIDDTGGGPDITGCATDDNYVWWAGTDGNASYVSGGRTIYNAASFVYATNISNNDTLVSFSSGTTYTKVFGHNYSAIGLLTADSNCVIGDVSVQKTGNYLYFTRPNKNMVYVFNKNTGAAVTTISFNTPTKLKISSTGSYLWLVHDSSVAEKYTINGDGTLTTTGVDFTTSYPIVGMDFNSSGLLVCEGGANQIIKTYNPVTGAFISSFGQAGGYLTNAVVADDKFYWKDVRQDYFTFLSISPDGSFWVGDNGNVRMQHYNANKTFYNNISWTPIGYAIAVDPNNTNRVWFEYMEYQVDYSKPLDNGANGSWKLVKNWGGDVANYEFNGFSAIKEATTFSNGSTFCYLVASNSTSSNPTFQLVRLNNDGTKTRTGIIRNQYDYIDKSGDLYKHDRFFVGQANRWYKYSLTGYNGNGYPQWGNSVALDSFPSYTLMDAGIGGDINHYRPNTILSNGSYIAFNSSSLSNGYHLEGIRNGIAIWKTEYSTYKYYAGGFPTAERFDIGNGVRNAGTMAVSLGNTVVTGYNGEFYKGNGQVNVYNHVYGNGLALGQFGYVPDFINSPDNPAGFAGNALCLYLTAAGGDSAYLHNNDESVHSFVHRWKIKNLNSIKTQVSVMQASYSPVVVDYTDLLRGLPLTKGEIMPNDNSGWTFNTANQIRSSGATWIASTGRFSYDRYKPDLSFQFGNINITADTVTRDLLGLLPGTVNNWLLTSSVNFNGNNTNNNQVQFYIDVIDSLGNILTRSYLTKIYTGTGTLVMYTNGTITYSTPLANSGNIIYTKQNFSLKMVSNQLYISYAGQPFVSVSPLNAGAVKNRPSKLRLIFNQAENNNYYGLGFAILAANFYTNQ